MVHEAVSTFVNIAAGRKGVKLAIKNQSETLGFAWIHITGGALTLWCTICLSLKKKKYKYGTVC